MDDAGFRSCFRGSRGNRLLCYLDVTLACRDCLRVTAASATTYTTMSINPHKCGMQEKCAIAKHEAFCNRLLKTASIKIKKIHIQIVNESTKFLEKCLAGLFIDEGALSGVGYMHK